LALKRAGLAVLRAPVGSAWAKDTGADLAKTDVNGASMANATIIERLG
jgi:hypothetical protein